MNCHRPAARSASDLLASLRSPAAARAPRSARTGGRSASCALSITSVSTSMPPYEMKILAPHGSTGWLTPSERAVRTRRHVVRSASRGAPRDPASAVYQPVSATVTAVPRPAARPSALCRRECADSRDERDRGQRDRPLREAELTRPRGSDPGPAAARPAAARRRQLRASTQPDPELVSCSCRHLGRRAAHRVDAGLVLRERDHVAQVRLAGERPSSSGRSRARSRPSAAPPSRARRAGSRTSTAAPRPSAEQLEHLRLDLGLVDPEAAAAELVPVHDQVVGVRERVPGIARRSAPPTPCSAA